MTPGGTGPFETFTDYMQRAGRQYLLALLNEHNWRMTDAARASGINRTDFFKVIRRYGIEPRRTVQAREREAAERQRALVDLSAFLSGPVDRDAARS